MAKKQKPKTESEDRWSIRINLKRVHPFLRKEYRPLEKSEINSDKVFKELFPDEKIIQLYKLKAIYEVQR